MNKTTDRGVGERKPGTRLHLYYQNLELSLYRTSTRNFSRKVVTGKGRQITQEPGLERSMAVVVWRAHRYLGGLRWGGGGWGGWLR